MYKISKNTYFCAVLNVDSISFSHFFFSQLKILGMKNSIYKTFIIVSFINLISRNLIFAQYSLGGQVRTRTEIRDGLGNLVSKTAKPAAFTSQRTRLNFGYKWDRLTFGTSFQDIRVWGQDASTISPADGNRLMMHEGWSEIVLANMADTTIKFKVIENLSVKIGRQELIYDDVRLIGNLDWLQQGRRHDMVLVKAGHRGWQLDLGYAFNQNTDAFNVTGTTYTPGNTPQYMSNSKGVLVAVPSGTIPNGSAFTSNPGTNGASQSYKSFKSVYLTKKFNQTKYSALFFNDDFGKYKMDTLAGNVANGFLYGKDFRNQQGVNSRYTYGLMINHTLGNASGFGKIALQGAYYNQTGRDRDGNSLVAYHYMASATYQKRKLSITAGYEVLSGNDGVSSLSNQKSTDGKNRKFDPLYGTPHRHWGYMDYFYVGTNSPAGGLNNGYLKLKYGTPTTNIGVDLHDFRLNKATLKSEAVILDKHLGNEIDILFNHTVNKFTTIELGYSIMKASESMAIAKGQATTDIAAANFNRTGTWFYLMVNIRPDFLFTKPVAIK